ncbi:hypothetical protein ACVW1A_008146 [Bradyrhizobium sp. LB1.3]
MNALFPFPRMSVDAATFADTLDGLDVGLYLVDAHARLVHANTAGQAILDARDILLEIRGRLVASDPAVNQTLQHFFTVAGQGNAILGTSGVPMLGRDGQRHVAHALPLTSGTRRMCGRSVQRRGGLVRSQDGADDTAAFRIDRQGIQIDADRVARAARDRRARQRSRSRCSARRCRHDGQDACPPFV